MIFYRCRWRLFLVLLLSVLGCSSSFASATADSDWVAATVKSVRALDSARNTVLQELETLPPGSQDQADAVDFVVYLNTRISMYCEELGRAGADEVMADLPCPTEPPSGGAAGLVGGATGDEESEEKPKEAVGSGTTESPQMKTASLQDEFMKAMGSFDEMLAQEEGKIAARVPSQRETGGGGGSDGQTGRAGGGESGQMGQGSAGDGQGMESGEGMGMEAGGADSDAEMSGEMAGEAGSSGGPMVGGGTGNTQAGKSVAGVPQGNLPPPEDDDIVARQLREAAEKEQDPELKKKLWEEYWKYKGVVKK